jgi:hypothetical protein
MGWQWRNKRTTCAGSVLFRGKFSPRAQEFAHLERQGFAVAPADANGAAHWALWIAHPDLGEAKVICLRDCPRPPRQLIDFDPMLTRAERERAYLGESTVSVIVQGQREDVLRDRKTLLRFLRAVMGNDGIVAVDHTAQRFWPAEALDDELCHDADLDIESLYTLHAVTADEEDDEVVWLHSHGLAEIGLFDFDVLRPSEDLLGRGRDALRAIAFAILEGQARRNRTFGLFRPNGAVRFVDVREFRRRGEKAANELRAGGDGEHNRDRVVLCEAGGALLSRFFGKLMPSRMLSRPMPEEGMVTFSPAASELMAERAKGTYLQFRQLAGEFAEFDFSVIVKLGYRVDHGERDDEREHMWFSVNELRDDRIDATLECAPFGIARMKKGQRGWHGIESLTTPRHTVPARQIRGSREEFRQLMREARRMQEAG